MQRENAYSKEAALKNLARRELANGLEKDPIYKLRLQCLSRGATGILGLSRWAGFQPSHFCTPLSWV